jgi:hypothetical protein
MAAAFMTWDSSSNGSPNTWDSAFAWDSVLPDPTPPHTMPNDNKISATISAQDKTDILAAFGVIKAKLPFLINLTPTERRRMPTLGTGRGGMDETFAMEMSAHPELVPGFVDTAELALDRALWNGLAEFMACATEICEGIQDTHQAAGSDIYNAYLSFYQNVRQAAKRGVVGADSIYANLRRFFPSGGGGGPTPTPPTP